MHLFVTDPASQPLLLTELQQAFPAARHVADAADRVTSEFDLPSESSPCLAFARQLLADVQQLTGESIKAWSGQLLDAVVPQLPDNQPWQLHIVPRYGDTHTAGRRRCGLIRGELLNLLKRKRRRLLKGLIDEPMPFTPECSLVQLLLTAPDGGYLSLAVAPWPHAWRRVMSPFVLGQIEPAHDPLAPSRAFAKLVEAEQRLGAQIECGERCLDLGSSPGSWTYVAANRGAEVISVDRSPLRADLMEHRRVTFHRGDAFKYTPDEPVDWLLCDVIAAPQRCRDLLLEYLRRRWARRFVVTIKFKGAADLALLDELKRELPSLCDEFYLLRLCANKNEVCTFGTLAG